MKNPNQVPANEREIVPVQEREDRTPLATDNLTHESGVVITRKMLRCIFKYFEYEMDPLKAVVAAGYKGDPQKQWQNLQHNPNFIEALLFEAQRIRNKHELSMDEVIEGLRDEAKRTDEGSSHNARVSAYNTLARIVGAFDPKTRDRGTVVAIHMDLGEREDESE